MDKILTLVIPSYNMEEYLPYCLDSLLVKENLGCLEVLVVNDGSRDRTSEIAHGYEKSCPDVFRVIDKENGNYGSCVNRGLQEARGKYIKILDADDSFDTVNFDRFISFLIKQEADLILSDFAVVDTARTTRKIIRYNLGDGEIFNMNDVCTESTFKNMHMHAVTYRKEILLSIGYRQTEKIAYTDQQWIFLPMTGVKTVARFRETIYKYQIGRSGQTVDPAVKAKSMAQTARCALDMAVQYESIKDHVVGKPVQEYLYARITPLLKEIYVFSLTHYGADTKDHLIKFDNELNNISNTLYNHIGCKETSSFLGFEYINYWRGHKTVNIPLIRILSKIYITILKLKKLRIKPDPMEVPSSFD